jgi:hypothetical protein
MHRVLLGLAATAALAVPATAQNFVDSGFGASNAFGDIRFGSPPPEIGPGRYLPVRNGGRDRRSCGGEHCRHVRVGDEVAIGYGYGAGGYYDYGDFDGNRSFSPDKWNDWWHERPERAFPRWMSHNQSCERIWWSGGRWRC